MLIITEQQYLLSKLLYYPWCYWGVGETTAHTFFVLELKTKKKRRKLSPQPQPMRYENSPNDQVLDFLSS